VVQQPGVLAFLEALRRSGRLAGHAAGGLIPAYADGGPVDAGKFRGTLSRLIEQLLRGYNAIHDADLKNVDNSIKLVKSIVANAQSVIDNALAHSESLASVQNTLGPAIDGLRDILDQIQGKAQGGLLGGRGTGTSDSNLAWVSRGEHIMPASAVRQPGVLAFLEALRRSGGNLRNVMDGMGRFALGGMVRAPLSVPAFAGGGMHNVTIAFPGLPDITGLRASSGVVDELRKAAAMAQVRSGGRKPSRYS
jgi:hypothetical protein